MNGEQRYIQLREASWRGKLDAGQEAELRAWLEAHPECREDWESEMALTQALRAMPDVPLSSNFTARVVAEAKRATRDEQRRHHTTHTRWWPFRWNWLSRAAVAGAAAVVVVFSCVQFQSSEREELALSLATVTEVASTPSPDLLQDFDTIRALAQSPRPDEELLTLLQ